MEPFPRSTESRSTGSRSRGPRAAGHGWLAWLLIGASTACASNTDPQGFGRGRVIEPGPGRFRESELLRYPFGFDTHVGIRLLRDDDGLGNLDRQAEGGVSFLVPLIADDPAELVDPRTGFLGGFNFDIGLRYAFDSSETTINSNVEQRVESQTFDISAGLFFSPLQYTSRFQPYVGGGLAFLFIDADLEDAGIVRSDRDSVLTSYVRTGARFEFDYGRHVGLDVRWLNDADVRIDGLGADVGAVSVTLVFGADF